MTDPIGTLVVCLAMTALALWLAVDTRHQLRTARLERDAETLRADRAEEEAAAVTADADQARRVAAEAVADLDTRNARLTVERDQARAKTTAAYDEGYRALAMLDEAITRQHTEFTESLTAWQGIAGAALLLPAPRPALPPVPPVPRAPELLPGGEHALVEGEPATLLQLDDLDVVSLASLPAGTNGTGAEAVARAYLGEEPE